MAGRAEQAAINYGTGRVKGAATSWATDALAQKFPETLGYKAATLNPNTGVTTPASSYLGNSLGVAGGIGGAYGLYQLGKGYGSGIKDWKTNAIRGVSGGLSGMALAGGLNAGAALLGYGPLFAALGPIGAVAAIASLAAGMIKNGKSKEQVMRDATRSVMQEAGLSDKEHMVTLANGKKAFIGGDGRAKFVGKDGKEYKQGFESDWSNPLTGEAVQYQSLINSLTVGPKNENLTDKGAITANLINALVTDANSKEDVAANFKSMLGGSKISARNAWRQVGDMVNSKQISADQGTIYHNALKNAYGQDYEKWGAEAGEDTMGPIEGAPVAAAPAVRVNRTPAKSRRKKQAAPTPAPTPAPVQAPTILPGPNALMTMPRAMTPEEEAEALARVSAQNQRRM